MLAVDELLVCEDQCKCNLNTTKATERYCKLWAKEKLRFNLFSCFFPFLSCYNSITYCAKNHTLLNSQLQNEIHIQDTRFESVRNFTRCSVQSQQAVSHAEHYSLLHKLNSFGSLLFSPFMTY